MVRFQATGVGYLGDESGASSLPTGPEFTALPPDGVVPWIRAPLPFPAPGLSLTCALRDAELVSCSTKLVEHCLVRLESC